MKSILNIKKSAELKKYFILILIIIMFSLLMNIMFSENIQRDPVIPLEVGNYWYYSSLNNTSPSYIFRITGEKKIGKYNYKILHVETDSNPSLQYYESYNLYLRIKKSSLYCIGIEGVMNQEQGCGILDQEFLILKYPSNTGSKICLNDVRIITLNNNEIINYNNKPLETIVYSISYENYSTKLWFAPGIGMVKEDGNLYGIKYSLMLNDYKLVSPEK